MPEQITINVSIDPAVEPYVDAVLGQIEEAIGAMEMLWPHLNGAFTSLAVGWNYLSEEQKTTLLERSPRLSRAVQLRGKLFQLLNDMPELNMGN